MAIKRSSSESPSLSQRSTIQRPLPPLPPLPSHPSARTSIATIATAYLDGDTSSEQVPFLEDPQIQKFLEIANEKRRTSELLLPIGANTIDDGLLSPVSNPEYSRESAISNFTSGYDRQRSSTATARHHSKPLESYPVYISGDLVINSSPTKSTPNWQLHASTLSRHSTWFARSIQEQDEPIFGPLKSYAYNLREVDGHISLSCRTGDDSPHSLSIKFRDTAEKEAIFQAYDQVFGAFYNIAPQISSTDIKIATSQAEQILVVAQELGCTPIISAHIGNALLQYRQTLFKAILADAPRYLLLALALQNDFIYTESLIHLVGAYPCSPWPTPHSALPEDTRNLIARKAKELDRSVLEIERELLLLTIVHGPKDKSFNYYVSSEFDTWFVVQIFREQITTALREFDKTTPSLKRGSFFRKIRAGGSQYMAYEEVRDMLVRVMPSALDLLREDLADLKASASQIVEELARNELSLDVEDLTKSEITRAGKKIPVGWLTCAKVEKADIPWRARVAEFA